jgi:2-keto-3-deoxy-L-rhamnonate aldolase RhmA
MPQTFREKLSSGTFLIGSFVKTPAPHIVEIAGLAGLDFVVLDAEHAPFTARDLDLGILAGRASGIDVLVRLADGSARLVQQALDLGAAGILVPRVGSPAAAAAIVAAARFAGGGRGYSNSPRYAAYGGTGMPALLEAADGDAAVILQIEDIAGVQSAEEIAAVPGIDALFIGRADLALAYHANDARSPLVDDAATRIARAARQAGVALGTFSPDAATYASKSEDGVTMLVMGSDQSALRRSWSSALQPLRDAAS